MNPYFNIGDSCIAFDSYEWSKTGDSGDNRCFYKKAVITNLRKSDAGEPIADLIFENGVESKGHFLYGLVPLNRELKFSQPPNTPTHRTLNINHKN